MEKCINDSFVNSSQYAGCSDNSAPRDIHAVPLLDTKRELAFIYIGIISVALLVGVVGNIVILVVQCCVGDINKIGKEFIVNLAMADLCVTAIADPMCIVGVVKGEMFFDDKMVLCEIVASMCLTACFCAFLSLTMLTLNRYVYICHNEIYDKIYKKHCRIIMCLLCWIVAFLCEFPNILGWGGHYFDRKNHQCIWDRTSSFSYTLMVSAGLIGFPLVVMGICYFLMFKRIWQTKRDVYMLAKDNPHRGRKAWNETVKASRTLFCIFVVFAICWTPYAVIIVIDMENTLSVEIHLFFTLLAHLHSSLNCLIFLIFNNKFKKTVFLIFGCAKNLQTEETTESITKSKTEVHHISTSFHDKTQTYNVSEFMAYSS